MNKKTCLIKKFKFSAAHRMYNEKLPDNINEKYFGKCQNVHGHNYFFEITLEGIVDKEKGFFINVHDLNKIVTTNIIKKVDHQLLNDVLPNSKNKPVTMEVLTEWIWKELNQKMNGYNIIKIRLWENDNNSVEIYKDLSI